MKKNIGLIGSAMKFHKIVFFIVGLLILFGGYALYKMPRQEMPTFTIRQGLVIGVYPGATSKEVAEQMTTQVERYLYGFKEIKKEKTYSHSKDGMMIIFVELRDEVKNSDEFWAKLNHGLNNFKAQLPSGVLALFSDNDFGDTSALLITLESDSKTYKELEGYLNNLEDKLRRIKSVSKLRHFGLQKEQISIYLEKNKLEKYGLSPSSLMVTMFSHGFTTSAGSIDNGNIDAPIHVNSIYKNEADIAEQIIYADPNGHIIRLKDVAKVVREYPEPDSYIKNNGKKCLLISMEMQSGNNIVQYGQEVDKVLQDFQKTMPDGLSIKRIADQPKVVGDSISNFLREFMYAIIAVILVTMLLLPFRVASVAASSIPISIFISLGLMYAFGMELNTVTLAGLIVVLGMIVDNSIVIVDSYMEHLDHGESRWHASVLSARELFRAIFSATLAISVTFFPFLITLKGMFNDFVLMFPWTVTITLGISLLVAIIVIPYMQYHFIKTGFIKTDNKKPKFDFLGLIQKTYDKYLLKAFSKPKLTLALGGLSVILGIIIFNFVPQRLFPTAERNQFAIEIYLPSGSSIHKTEAVADSLEKILKKDENITSITSFIGTSSPRFHTTYAPKVPAKNYAQFIVNTTSNKATEELLDKYSAKYRNNFAEAYVRFKQLDFQAVAAPIEVRISGDSVWKIMQLSDSLIPKIRSVKQITWVRTNYDDMQPVANVEIDAVQANRLGIDKSSITSNLAMRFDGIPMTTLWENDYPISVKLKTEKNGKESFNDIGDEYMRSIIPTASVPLRQIAQVKPNWENGQIVRRNGVLTLTILADIERNADATKLFKEVKEKVDKSTIKQGLSIEYGGSYEDDNENLPNIMGALVISIIVIFFILIFHFKRISLATLVLSSSVLSLFGASLGLILLGKDFGVTCVLGIVGLIGIIVRNGIIMLDYAEELRLKHGKSILDAAIEAGKRRMRPIFLTSAGASMGVVPMIISNSPLWAPMGTVIFFGTLTSMVLILLILPVAYYMLFKKLEKKDTIHYEHDANFLNVKKTSSVITILLVLFGFNFSNAQTTYSLEQCKKMALENNSKVKNSQLEIQASEQVKKGAFTKYFPTANATITAIRSNDYMMKKEIPGGNLPVYDGNLANLGAATQYAYFPAMNFNLLKKIDMASVNVTQPLFAGGRIYNGNKLASLGIDVSKSKANLSKNEVALSTEEQYWQVVSLNEKMKTLEAYSHLIDTLYKNVNDAYSAGLINRNDVMKVTLKQSEIKMNRLKLDNGIKLASMALCQYIGLKYDSTVVFTDKLSDFENPLKVFIKADQAVQNREEYSLLQKNVEANKLQTKMKLGEYLPEAGIGAMVFGQGIDGEKDKLAMVYVNVSIPISAWWEGSHSLKEHKIKEQIAENDKANMSELLVLQIRKSWNDLEESYKQISVAEVTIQQAEENLKINTDNYKSGMINVSDMLEAQAILQEAKDQLINAQSSYKTKLIAYMQATGRQ